MLSPKKTEKAQRQHIFLANSASEVCEEARSVSALGSLLGVPGRCADGVSLGAADARRGHHRGEAPGAAAPKALEGWVRTRGAGLRALWAS